MILRYNVDMKKLLKKLFGRSGKTGAFATTRYSGTAIPSAKSSTNSKDMRETANYIGTHFGRALQRLGDR